MKVAIVGGGAYSWTPELVRDFAVHGGFGGAQVCLMDIAAEPLALAEKLCRKIVAAARADLTIVTTLDRGEALAGADVVLVCINTGASRAHGHDTAIPLRYGIRSAVGDTAGPSGVSRALRNIPVVTGIARDVRRLCPRAWLINVTNPMTTLTRAMGLEHRRTVGYCHEVQWLRLRAAMMFGLPRFTDVEARIVGINHMTWVTALKIGDNPDGLAAMRDLAGRRGGLTDPNDGHKPSPVVKELYDLYGALPTSLDAHIADFYAPYAVPEMADRYGLEQYTGAMEERNVRQRNKQRAEGMLSGALPLNLEHSMEDISHMVHALRGGGRFLGAANVPNVGQVDNLARGAVLESTALFDWDGVTPLAVGTLRPLLAGVLQSHIVSQELTVEAGLKGDRRLAIEAMMALPMIRDFAAVPRMVDELLEANREYLPQFFG
jgi:alpha-galactosidase